ncbi:MAG: hypothetical protein IT423_15870 [Pirellulaceae bacterium]|nr:hypothetical protein [Pirellulaceae bacterium]
MSVASLPSSVPEAVDFHARCYTKLSRLSNSALIPWMLISFISIMAFGGPNAIITPLTWVMLITIWSYPITTIVCRLVAWTLQRYGQPYKANLAMSISASIGAFLFAMLIAPLLLLPVTGDGYFALMGSGMLSIILAGWTVRRAFRAPNSPLALATDQ